MILNDVMDSIQIKIEEKTLTFLKKVKRIY